MAGKADQPSLTRSPATPTLQALVNELASVEDWHLLGVNLGLQGHQLHEIERNYRGDSNRCKTETLYLWQRNAKDPSWGAIVNGLCLMQQHVVADGIRRKYCCSSTTSDLALIQQSTGSLGTSIVPSSDTSPSAVDDSLVLAKKNLQKIKDEFAPLLALADRVLQRKDIDMPNFRLFLTAHYLPEEDDNDTRAIDPSKFVSEVLGTAQSVSEILQSLLVHRLLSYKNFDVLHSIINHYASDELEMKTKLDEYEQELAGYILATKMKDYLNAEIHQTELSEPDAKLLHQLSVKVKANVTEKTLKYVRELRDSLAYRVKLPVTAVLFHKIARGCIEITWLLPCHLTEFTIRQLQESTNYFQQENILRVTIAGRCVYEELPPEQESARKEEIDSERKRDPDNPDAGNLSSVQNDPDPENLSSLQLIDDEPEGPEDVPEHDQGMRCSKVICTNFSLLYTHLDPKKFLPVLPEKDLMNEEQLKCVESCHQRFAKNVFVIRALLWYDRPFHGLLKFCDTLETTPGQEHLGRKLLKDYNHPPPVHVQSPSADTAVHSDLSETSELFQQLQREVMDLLDHFPNALAKLKQVLASLVLPVAKGRVVSLVDPLSYESAQTVRELFRLMASYWNPLSTDLLDLLAEALGCNQAGSQVAEFVEVRASKGHLVLCIHQLPTLASGENDLDVADLKTVHNAPLSELQSFHPAVFARLPEHKVTSTRTTVRISVEVNKPLLCIADYEQITTALSGFFQVPKAALMYAGCSKAPLVLCWLASYHLLAYIRSTMGGVLLMSAHRLLAENKVTGIAVGDQTYKCPTIKEVELWEACQYGLVEHVLYLLATGVNVNMTTFDESFALFYASRKGYEEIVELLLKAGAAVDLQNKDGITPLLIACKEGHLPVAKHLIAAKADVNRPNEDGTTPLFIACQKGHLPVVEFLIAAKADVNTPRKTGATPLFIACQEGHLPVVEFLIAAKADVNTPRKDGVTPLMKASEKGHPSVVKVLLQAGATINTTLQTGATPLYFACQEGHLPVVESLIAAKADVNTPRKDGTTPLYIACQNGHLSVVEHLIAAKADVNTPKETGATPLLIACQKGHLPVVEYLIAAKADVNTPSKHGVTPLMKASHNGHPSVVKVLLQAGATINTISQFGTALHVSVLGQHEDIVELLLTAHIDPDLPDEDSRETALIMAAREGSMGIVRKLVQHGASVNLANKNGLTAVDIASCEGHMDVCQELLAHQFL